MQTHTDTSIKRAVVIGAGLSGLTAALTLQSAGWPVTVVEKSRGAGGRMSTRRQDALRFDHGAQYFTARDVQFRATVESWVAQGRVARWQPRLGVVDADGIEEKRASPQRFVGVPAMSAVCAALAQELRDCRYDWHVEEISAAGPGWRLRSTAGEVLDASHVLLTCPPAQIPALIPALDRASTGAILAGVDMRPCWAVMAHFDRPLLERFDAAFVNVGPLSWVCSQRDRPGRPQENAWVLHASAEWSETHLEASPDRVCDTLLRAARALPGSADDLEVFSGVAHRWRYAIARAPLGDQVLALHGEYLIAAGDWAFGSRVEGAWRSGRAAAARWLSAPAGSAG